jgi:dephospho-CoA kinase
MGKLIGILGRKRSGKDTLGSYMIENYNYQRYAYADPIKDTLKVMFDLNDEQLNDKKETIDERWGVSPRIIMQQFGTEICRNDLSKYIENIKLEDETLWIKLFRIFYEKNKDKDIVVTDVRFLDEINAIKSLGGKIVKINRDNLEYDGHCSEKDIDNYNPDLIDYTIDNNYTFDDLYSQIDTFLNLIILE